MSGSTEGRLRLTILGGFLGSGKTTWLRHQLHAGAFSDAFLIVNEAAETPVDDALLGRASKLGVLAGGCQLHRPRQLVAELRRICDERSRYRPAIRDYRDRARDQRGCRSRRHRAVIQPILFLSNTSSLPIVVTADALPGWRSLPLGRLQVEAAGRLWHLGR